MAEEKNGNKAYRLKLILEILIAVLFSGVAALVIMGQYRQKVDTHTEQISDLKKDQVFQGEKLQTIEKEQAVTQNQLSNLSTQMSEGFKDVKMLIKEMRQELKEEIKTKRDK